MSNSLKNPQANPVFKGWGFDRGYRRFSEEGFLEIQSRHEAVEGTLGHSLKERA
jgi:hypothetical protein